MAKKTTKQFVDEAKSKHDDKPYDYTNTVYHGANNKVEVLCKLHGVFSTDAKGHLTGNKGKGKGCPQCAKENARMSTAEFIDKAKAVFAYKNRGYTYEKTSYTGSSERVIFTCPEHGIVQVIASNHLSGRGGCPECGKRKNQVASFPFEGRKYRSITHLAQEHGLSGKPLTAFLKRIPNFSKATQKQIRTALDTEHVPNQRPVICNGITYPTFTAFHEAVRADDVASYNTLLRWIRDEGIEPDVAITLRPSKSDGLGCVYKIEHKTTGEVYIGQTTMTPELRWQIHLRCALKNPSSWFQKALVKHGPDAFTLTVLASGVEAGDELSRIETEQIAKHGSCYPNGYNTLDRGQSAAPRGRHIVYQGKTYSSQKALARHLVTEQSISMAAAVYRVTQYGKTGVMPTNGDKLSHEKASEIRKLCNQAALTSDQIGKIYGVSRATVNQIKANKTWKE